MRKVLFAILIAGISYSQQNSYFISGTVKDAKNNSPLAGCNIYIPELEIGTNSDTNGKFKLLLPKGIYSVSFSYIGYKKEIKKLATSNKISNNQIELKRTSYSLNEVNITAQQEESSTIVQNISQKDLKKIPSINGDVLKSLQILPGVTANNELSSGYNVRGGSFDENLIYLNGYEIYRPALLQSGIEENQSVVNPDLTGNVSFYNGTFPARYGDRMSSAAEITYQNLTSQQELSGTFRANLLNSGVSLKYSKNGLDILSGYRYSYPSLFLERLHGTGTFKPKFNDFQLLAKYNYSKNSLVELFVLTANNSYENTPDEWVGNIRTDSGSAVIQAVTANFDGVKNYSFKTTLFGAKWKMALSSVSSMLFQASYYKIDEEEKRNLNSDYYFSPDASFPELEKRYLKTRTELIDDYYKMDRLELKGLFSTEFQNNNLTIGVTARKFSLENYIDETISERGDQILFDQPINKQSYWKSDLYSISGFVENNYVLSNWLFINLGVRSYYYSYNKEFVISPRASLQYWMSDNQKFTFSWGYYSQPPFYYELRNNNPNSNNKLSSQRAIHYVLGWEYQFKPDVSFQSEFYYKDLDNIIPFYLDKMKLEYGSENSLKAYAFGADLTFNGQITKGLRSWISYSYLNTREKGNGVDNYLRRILDQSHTFQLFFQDKIKKHPNWQSHLRLVFGTGYLYYNRETVTQPDGSQQIEILWNNRDEYSMYYRADMGLSAKFKFENKIEMLLVVEVLNVFNNYNYAGYEWMQLFKSIKHPFKIPQIFSKRFFNIGVEFTF